MFVLIIIAYRPETVALVPKQYVVVLLEGKAGYFEYFVCPSGASESCSQWHGHSSPA